MATTYEEMERYTFDHFQKLARENRFPEHAKIPHREALCLICHPEKIEGDVFGLVLRLVTACIAERRPICDTSLISAIEEELAINEQEGQVTLEGLLNGDPEAAKAWRVWAWNSINVAFEMLSMHGAHAPSLSLEEAVAEGKEAVIEEALRTLLERQKAQTRALRSRG